MNVESSSNLGSISKSIKARRILHNFNILKIRQKFFNLSRKLFYYL